MAKFRRKPGVIEAVQLDPYGPHRLELPDGVRGLPSSNADNWSYQGCRFFVTTIQGQDVEIKRGEFVIAESDGKHYYPCDSRTFKANYEPVTE